MNVIFFIKKQKPNCYKKVGVIYILIIMIKNEVSGVMNQDTLDKILNVLDEAYALIPVLTTLSVQQRMENIKMGDASIPFVQKAYEEGKSNADLLPSFVDLTEFKKDIDYDAALMQIEIRLSKLNERVSDTRMVVGSEAMNAALAIYNYVKQAVKQNIPGAKTAHENLKARFMYKKHDDVLPPTTV